ncbi:SMI1/KNR4 family protein [Nannocystis punicea]|uniref:SMI1/KNR4 family protein n=1 Tax=Nannocystis punicea TaxID=2995304 RepID=A0ABY7GV85_9BACT|nr:SMI1/KNR4 family protein [Nannocystis poenicansa]WAS90881.1 SMI1/KNR4 family protein [Nannocystis poenicansa]
MGATPTFRARFEAMVACLRAHPQVEVYEVVIGPPASEVDLREAEEAVGSPLPPALREFYGAHDGVFLEWGLRGREYASRTVPFGWPDERQPPGCINLLPVRKAMSTSWRADRHVGPIQPQDLAAMFGAMLEPEPPVRVVCVDHYSRCKHGDLIFGPEPVMMVSDDYGADMGSSDCVTFSTYLDMTLAIFGADRYYCGLGNGWTRAPQFMPAWTSPPDLDRTVAWMAENTGGG